MAFRPCIDLHHGKVKQIVGGSLSDTNTPQTNFISDKPPSYYAKLYKNDKLSGGHVIKLGEGNDKAAKEALNTYPNGLQIGGGINSENAHYWLEEGAAAVIVTSYIFNQGEIHFERLKSLSQKIGKNRLVLDLSCRKKDENYYIVTDRWQKFTSEKLNQALFEQLSNYCFEFLIHAVDQEGKQSGIDEKLIKLITKNSPIPSVYAGGISSNEEIDLINKIGEGKIDYTVGSALDIFGGKKLKYKNLV